MKNSKSQLTDGIINFIWNEHLDGSSINMIREDIWTASEDKRFHPPVKIIKDVLDKEPPENIKNDLRYLHKVKGCWIYSSGKNPFVIAFYPPKLRSKFFSKGIMAIKRDFKTLNPGNDLNVRVIEGLELDVLFKFAHEKNYQAWIINKVGEIERYNNQYKK